MKTVPSTLAGRPWSRIASLAGRRGCRRRGFHRDRRHSGEHPDGVASGRRADGRPGSRSSRPPTRSSRRRTPGWNVDVQYQTWGNHLQKFDATLAGGNAPDVIEMGNTEMTKYMAAGAFQDLRGSRRSRTGHLARGSRRLRQVRRQALRRPVLRGVARRHLPHRPVQEAGVKVPTSLAEFTAAREEARREEQARRASRPSTSPAPTGTSR